MGDIPSWIGARVGDRVGMNVGTVCDVYYDEATSRPAWLLVDLGARLVLVPADGALSWRETVVVPHDRQVIHAAPVLAAAPHLLAGELACRLARHYDVRMDRYGVYAPVRGVAQVARAA